MTDTMPPPTPSLTPSPTPAAAPAEVIWAVRLLWLGLSIATAQYLLGMDAVLEAMPPADAPGRNATLVGLLMPLAWLVVAGGLNVAIARGRNWARITSLLLAAAGLAAQIAFSPRPEGLQGLVTTAGPALNFAAFYLLFLTPGRLWFRREAATVAV